TGDEQRKRAYACPADGVFRQQRRPRMRFLEIFDDRERLRETLALVFQRRQQSLRVECAIGGLAGVALGGVDRGRDGGGVPQVQRDAHAEGCGAAEIRMQFHFNPSSFAAFSFSISGRTSGLMGSLSKSAIQRSGAMTG